MRRIERIPMEARGDGGRARNRPWLNRRVVHGGVGAVVFVFVLWAGMALPSPVAAQTWSTTQYERQIRGETELRVEVEYGMGTVTLLPAEAGILYRARIRYDEEGFVPRHDFRSGILRVGVEGSSRRTSFRRGEQEGELTLRLSRDLPLQLKMEFGAVRSELDLGGLQLQELELATGASDTRIRVSEPNPGELEQATFKVGAAAFVATDLGRLNAREINVEAGVGDVRLELGGLTRSRTRVQAKMGLGSLEIRVPDTAGVRMTRSTFLSSVNAPGLERTGNAYVSPNWDRAEIQVEIHVESAFGSVSILPIR
jgi:hypothetical protein